MRTFLWLVNAITSGRGPFVSNKPVPQARDLAFERLKMNRRALDHFLTNGAWTKEPHDAS